MTDDRMVDDRMADGFPISVYRETLFFVERTGFGEPLASGGPGERGCSGGLDWPDEFDWPDGLDWPNQFVIVTAWATTGEQWTSDRCRAADRKLEQRLHQETSWRRRITGFSPTTRHAEPGWAAVMPWSAACDLGLAFQQDAIYHVLGNVLSIIFCDARRRLIPAGTFRERLRTARPWDDERHKELFG